MRPDGPSHESTETTTNERSVEANEHEGGIGDAPLIRSLPDGKMDSPNSARFRLASRGDIPTAPAVRGTADEQGSTGDPTVVEAVPDDQSASSVRQR